MTSGQFTFGGESWDVENNVWIVGDPREVDRDRRRSRRCAIDKAVDGRRVKAIVCTHAHNDHVNAAADLAERTGAPILRHRSEDVLWGLARTAGRTQSCAAGTC